MAVPRFAGNEKKYLKECIDSTFVSSVGKFVDRFEEEIDFLQQTNDNGVMTRPIWELMNRLPMFENCENDGLKNTIWFADRVVNIPSSVK